MKSNTVTQWQEFRSGAYYENNKNKITRGTKNFLMTLFRVILIVGISYVILSPVIGIVTSSFFSDSDQYNPMVFTIPINPTLLRYEKAITHLKYFQTLGFTLAYSVGMTLIQVFICSMVGYGFARFDFPLKKLLFGCVVVMIVLPVHTIMLPLYVTFRNFDPLSVMSLVNGGPTNLMGTVWPMTIMTLLGTGLRSGLYIYIFNQFFRGLPKEIEEAALVDGAGTMYTYFRIMLVNAMPAVITVSVFSLVWQYNDVFYGNLFNLSSDLLIGKRIATLSDNIANIEKVLDPNLQRLFMNAGVVLMMIPIVIIYLVLQKQFIEGVERSGIVG